MRPHVLRSRLGYFGRLVGPFEYVMWAAEPQHATPMPAWKAFQWAAALGCEAEAVG